MRQPMALPPMVQRNVSGRDDIVDEDGAFLEIWNVKYLQKRIENIKFALKLQFWNKTLPLPVTGANQESADSDETESTWVGEELGPAFWN